MEIWKDIPGFEGEYQVSDNGRVRSLDRPVVRRNKLTGGFSHNTLPGRILKPQAQKSGHLEVKLGFNPAKHYRIHRLVMLAFEGPCPEGKEVCHNDNNPANNHLKNLRYDTRSANKIDVVHAGNHCRQKLSVAQATEIIHALCSGANQRELAKRYGVHSSTISKINQRKNFAWLWEELGL